jgi:tellurite resistance protein TerC
MLAVIHFTCWHWIGFIVFVLIMLAIDLGIFNRRAHVIKFREALLWTSIWFCLAMLFALLLHLHPQAEAVPDASHSAVSNTPARIATAAAAKVPHHREALEFLTGYLIELSLSMDNVFVIALIFAYFRIPALILRFDWILYAFGFLLLASGVKMLFVDTQIHPEKSRILRLARKFYPVSPGLDGQNFVTIWQGARALTPLALVLLMVETTDLLFAVDSIPAVFAVTKNPFIVFSSNVFAIIGLRSL